MVEARASAPGKVILFGEHAVNRGQSAIAAAVGLSATCRIRLNGADYCFQSGARVCNTTRDLILELKARVDAWRQSKNYDAIRHLAGEDFFAPQQYVLANAFGDELPTGMTLIWDSELPASSGLGSGGAAFVALVSAISAVIKPSPSLIDRATWAHSGDVIAHGGVASALDTQTSLLGGIIRFNGQGLAESLAYAPGLTLVIGHTGVSARTSDINTRVRHWLEARPASRLPYFQTIGALARAACPALEQGDWPELGRLLTLNQLALEKIGVSCPEIERLIEAALEAGAYGAKLSGSGGGGIVIALTSAGHQQAVAEALRAAGGTALIPEIAVPGARHQAAEPIIL